MAITQHTVSIAGTWTNADLINQLEDAFTYLEWHGETKTGLIIGITTFTGGNYTEGPVSNRDYYDVFAKTTSGVGTGASFEFDINAGYPNKIQVNRPGYGYTGGEEITIDGADIGRTSGAGDISFKVSVASTIANGVSYAITATNYYELSGTDRNGAVSGKASIITIKEGDTIKFVNDTSSSSYRMNIVWNTDEQSGTGAGETNRVANVYGQNAYYTGYEMSWTPVSGQAGVYLVRDDNGNDGVTGIGTIIVLPADPADVTLTSFGSTTSFYAKNITDNYPYGVLRHEIAPNKKFGDTYRGFAFHTNNNIVPHVCSGFCPNKLGDYSYGWIASGGFGYGERNAGNLYLDNLVRLRDATSSLNNANNYIYSQDGYADANRIQVGGNTTQQLDLNIYKSNIDPKFAVLSYNAPTVSSTKLRDNTFETIIFHNFTNNEIWDSDELFLGGWTKIIPVVTGNDAYPALEFRTNISGERNFSSNAYASKRMVEFGYNSMGLTGGTVPYYTTTNCSYHVQAVNSPHTGSGPLSTDRARVYYRNSNDDPDRSWGGVDQTESGNQYDKIGALADFNAVIKGIPLNGNLVPIPYYIPDDFVLISFHYNNPNTNISQGDTITISGSEIYTVITGSYNQQDHTRGILFCARTT